jgi:hypothetical protein
MANGWMRGGHASLVLAMMGTACNGVEAPPLGGADAEGGGTKSVFVHGSGGACGGMEAGGSSGTGSSPLPGDFTSSGGSAAGSTVGSDQGGAGAAGGTQPLAAGAGGSEETPLAQAFLFSEYVEGSSTYKALEISALEDSSFTGCRLAVYFNGGTTPTGTALEGSLLAGESYVICSSALSGVISGCDRTAGLTFNGNDALALECDGVNIDVIGQVGFDPGTAWGSGDLSLSDHTLRRSCALEGGDADASDAFEPADQWWGAPQDSFEDLGVWSCEQQSAGGAPPD